MGKCVWRQKGNLQLQVGFHGKKLTNCAFFKWDSQYKKLTTFPFGGEVCLKAKGSSSDFNFKAISWQKAHYVYSCYVVCVVFKCLSRAEGSPLFLCGGYSWCWRQKAHLRSGFGGRWLATFPVWLVQSALKAKGSPSWRLWWLKAHHFSCVVGAVGTGSKRLMFVTVLVAKGSQFFLCGWCSLRWRQKAHIRNGFGEGGYGGGGRGKLCTYRYSVTTRMTPALRWAAMGAILMFHNCEGQSHKTVSTDHNLWSERRAEADSIWGPSAYQPTALSLGQTGSQVGLCGGVGLCTSYCCFGVLVVK